MMKRKYSLTNLSSHINRYNNLLFTLSPYMKSVSLSFLSLSQEMVSEIRSRAMEKLRRKTNLSDSFSWVFSPATKELYITSMEIEKIDEPGNEDNTGDEFYSVQSFLTCSSAATKEAFFSVEANFSRCSSLNGLNFLDEDLKRRTILQELFHCEGWPFGLCRKAVLLPPLPKSPSESWLWSKGTKIVKI